MSKTIKNISALLSFVMLLAVFSTAFVPAAGAESNSGTIHTYSTQSASKYGYIKTSYSAPSLSNGRFSPRGDSSLPSSYDSRQKGCITSVKHQGSFGTCWTFGSMAAAESSLILHNGYDINTIDLAELHLAYYGYNNAYDELGLLEGDSTLPGDDYADAGFLGIGGMHYISVLTLARWAGIVSEVDHPEFSYARAFRLKTPRKLTVLMT